jgi:hypothetical protein
MGIFFRVISLPSMSRRCFKAVQAVVVGDCAHYDAVVVDSEHKRIVGPGRIDDVKDAVSQHKAVSRRSVMAFVERMYDRECAGDIPPLVNCPCMGTRKLHSRRVNQLYSGRSPAKAVSRDDRSHVLSISQVYELPIGPGKKILNHGGMVAKNLLGGWSFSGHYSYASGTPVQISVGNGRPLAFSTFNRANIMPGSFDVNWDNYYKDLPVFNLNKFQFPGAWRVGDAVPFYSGFRNPFESSETVGVSKRFFLGEKVKAELRVEFDNVLNRMRVCGGDKMDNNPYDVAGLDPNNTNYNFGIVSPGAVCQGNTPRRGQAVLRITF